MIDGVALAAVVEVHLALGAGEFFTHVRLGVALVTALAVDAHAVRIGEFHVVVVINLAPLLVHALLTAAHAGGGLRMAADEPVGDVDVVNVLLVDVITAQPGEVIPVVALVHEFAHALFAIAEPDAAAVPINLAGNDVADDALLLDLLQRVDVAVLIAALEADDDLELLLIGHFGHFEHLAHAGAVHGDGLFHEHVFASVDGGFEMIRAEAGRRGEDDEVAGVDDLLVAFDAVVNAVIHLHALGVFVADVGEGAFGFLFEGIAHGVEHEVGVRRGERLIRRARATAAGANEADFDFVAAGGPGGLGDGESAGGSGGADKLAARGGRRSGWCVHEEWGNVRLERFLCGNEGGK